VVASFDYDVMVIGSGFGGSVAALRLSEKGYRVGVLEAGRRFDESTYPRTSWDVRNFLFAPRLGCYGIQRISPLRDVVVLSGAGVGGGSLVYANTLYEPAPSFFDDPHWSHITDWRSELAPFYDQAKRMLGATVYPRTTASDVVMADVAKEMGVADTYRPTPVGVFFGQPGVEVADPYFGGVGPQRRGCIHCGACMTGCRHHAKNTLTKNYLYLAERAGATVHPMTTVIRVRPLRSAGYAIDAVPTSSWTRRPLRTLSSQQVVFAASTLGTQRLLHRMRYQGYLPNLSPHLGVLTRTNSEAILGARSRHAGADFSGGVAITSSFRPDEDTRVEPCRYGRGSDMMGVLQSVLIDSVEGRQRWILGLREMAGHVRDLRTLHDPRHWSEQTVILLVMQSLDNSITLYPKRRQFGRLRITTGPGHGQPSPTWIPVGHDVARRVAAKIDGIAGGTWGDFLDIPMTAHFIGGAVIGDSPRSGVIDPYHRLYGHPGLHVVDGTAVSANLGVNPALTITAQAERAMAYWPNRGDPDPRPPLGSSYKPLKAIAPDAPAVPKTAVGALRLPR
jgi:cholesterol oxidase